MKIKFLVEQMELISNIFRYIPIKPSPVEEYQMVVLTALDTGGILGFSNGEFSLQLPLDGFCEEIGSCAFSAKELSTLSHFFVGQKTIECSFSDSVLVMTGDRGTTLRIHAVETLDVVPYEMGSSLMLLSQEDIDFLVGLKGQSFSSGGCYLTQDTIKLRDSVHLAEKKSTSLNMMGEFSFCVGDVISTLMRAAVPAGGCREVFIGGDGRSQKVLVFSGAKMKIAIPVKEIYEKSFQSEFVPDFSVNKKEFQTVLKSFSSKKKSYRLDMLVESNSLKLNYYGTNLDQSIIIPCKMDKECSMISCNIKLLKDLLKAFKGKELKFHWDGRLLFIKDDLDNAFCLLAGLSVKG